MKGAAELDATAQELSDKFKTLKKKNGIAIAVKDLKSQMVDSQHPQIENVPLKNNGKPLVSKANIRSSKKRLPKAPTSWTRRPTRSPASCCIPRRKRRS